MYRNYIFILILNALLLASCDKNTLGNNDNLKVVTDIPKSPPYFFSVISKLDSLGYTKEEIPSHLYSSLPENYDLASYYSDGYNPYLVVGYDNMNPYLQKAMEDCNLRYAVATNKDGSIQFITCESSGNTCSIIADGNGDVTIIICTTNR